MNLSKSAKILLAVITILPLIYMALVMAIGVGQMAATPFFFSHLEEPAIGFAAGGQA